MSWPREDPIIPAQPGWFVVMFDYGFKRNDAGRATNKFTPAQIAKFDIAGALVRTEIFAWQLMNEEDGVIFHPLGMTGVRLDENDVYQALLCPDGTAYTDQKRMPLAELIEIMREKWRKLNDQIPDKPKRQKPVGDYTPYKETTR